jgi:SsrA-binding protein
MPASADKPPSKKLAANRKALRDFTVLDRLEAGIELRGTEVKSVRQGNVSLAGSFVKIEDGQVMLYHVTIPPYEQGNRFNHDPDRPRRLLLHRREIERLRVQLEQKGLSAIPLSVYLKRGSLVKLELGLCRGKRQADKRETLRRKTAEREADRAVADARRRG